MIFFVFHSKESKEYVFLRDFINCTGDTAGARLARWLQPDPRVEISHCRIILPEGEYYCGHELPVFVNIRDQDEQLLPVIDFNVKIVIEFTRSPQCEKNAEDTEVDIRNAANEGEESRNVSSSLFYFISFEILLCLFF
jgi:hypothetical protein